MTKRMRYAICAASVGLGIIQIGRGDVYLQVTPMAINSTLAADGWSGYKLTLQVDAWGQSVGETVSGWDFKNPSFQNLFTGTPGITGPLHQAWTIDAINFDPPQETSTATGAIPTVAQRTDSLFLNSGLYLSVPDFFTENNNGANGSNPPFTQSPLADVAADPGNSNGVDYGVGSSMTMSGVVAKAKQTAATDLAFVIVPTDPANGAVMVRGIATTSRGSSAGIVTQVQGRTTANLAWLGQTSATGDGVTWDTNGNHNWTNLRLTGGADVALGGDYLVFDDTHNAGGQRTVSLNSTVTPASVWVNTTSSYTLTGSGTISGPGRLIKSGSGLLTIDVSINLSKGMSIENGTLKVARPDFFFANGFQMGDLAGNWGALDLAGHNATVSGISEQLDGTLPTGNRVINSSTTPVTLTLMDGGFRGGITDGAGGAPTTVIASHFAVALGGLNTYTGPTFGRVSQLTLLSTGTFSTSDLDIYGGTLVFSSVPGVGGVATFTRPPNLIMNGQMNGNGATVTFAHLNGTTSASTISDTRMTVQDGGDYAGNISLGNFTLTGGNMICRGTWSANLAINGGTLTVLGSAGRQTGSISPGATVAGTGQVTGVFTVAGEISPGDNGAGALSMFQLVFSTGSKITFDVGPGNIAGFDTDLIHFTSLADNLSGSGNVMLDLVGKVDYHRTYVIFDNISTTGFTLGGIDVSGITNWDGAHQAVFGKSGNSYAVSFVSVPEPGTVGVLGIGAVMMLRRRNRL